MVEWSETFDCSGGEADGEAVDGVAVGPEVSHKPVAIAGEDEIVGGVVLEVGQGEDGEVVYEIAACPEILFGRVFAAEEADGGEVDGKDDAGGNRGWGVVLQRKDHERVSDDDGLVAGGCRETMEHLVEALFLLSVCETHGADAAEEQSGTEAESGDTSVSEMAEDPVADCDAGDGKTEADGDDEARGEHASVNGGYEIAEEGIEHEKERGDGLMQWKRGLRKESLTVCEAGEPARTHAGSAVRAQAGEQRDERGEGEERNDGIEDDFDHAGVRVEDLIDGDLVPGVRRELGDGVLNERLEGEKRSGREGKTKPDAGAEGAQERRLGRGPGGREP